MQRSTLVDYYVCVGISKWTVKRIQREASNGGPDFSSLAKQYKVSRRCIGRDTFNCESIRKRKHQLYEAKENETLVAAGNKTSFQDFVSSIIESYNGAWNFDFMYIYSAWLHFVLLLCFTFLLILKCIVYNHRRVKVCLIGSACRNNVSEC